MGRVLNEDLDTQTLIASAAAGANRNVNLPSIGSSASASGNVANSVGLMLFPGQYLAFTSSAALQTEAMTLHIAMELYNLPTTPTVDATGSAGTPNLAASTISEANTLQELVC